MHDHHSAARARATSVIRGCAAFDLVATGLLAWPPVARWFVGVLFAVNGVLGGTAEPPVFTALHWFFVSIAGALGVLWAVVRLLRPTRFLGLADAAARTWVAGVMLFHVLDGAPGILLLFVLTELAGTVVQVAALAPHHRPPVVAGPTP